MNKPRSADSYVKVTIKSPPPRERGGALRSLRPAKAGQGPPSLEAATGGPRGVETRPRSLIVGHSKSCQGHSLQPRQCPGVQLLGVVDQGPRSLIAGHSKSCQGHSLQPRQRPGVKLLGAVDQQLCHSRAAAGVGGPDSKGVTTQPLLQQAAGAAIRVLRVWGIGR